MPFLAAAAPIIGAIGAATGAVGAGTGLYSALKGPPDMPGQDLVNSQGAQTLPAAQGVDLSALQQPQMQTQPNLYSTLGQLSG